MKQTSHRRFLERTIKGMELRVREEMRIQAALFGLEDKTMRMPLPGMSSFISPDKPNFKITTVRDSAPFPDETSWNLLNAPFPSSPLTPGPSGQPAAHENRASVIMKTSDVSKSSVKSC